jgi:hypothetical protein
MPTQTPFLNLTTYNSTTDGSAVYFSDFRAAIAGLATTANFNLIDSFCSNASGSILLLQANKPIVKVDAYYVSPGYYAATGVTQITAYNNNMMIDLNLDTTNGSGVLLNINALGDKGLQKIDVYGNLAILESGDLRKNRHYLFIYNGSVWIWVGATSSDQISISGSPTEILMLSSASTIVASGSKISSFAPSSGSYVVMSLNGSLTEELLLQSGSGITLTVNSGNSTVKINNNFTAGSGMTFTYNNSASSLKFDISVTGSSIMSDTTGSTIKHNTSGITAGSYVQVIVDRFGHITSGCQVIGASGSFTSQDGQTITVTNGIITSMV